MPTETPTPTPAPFDFVVHLDDSQYVGIAALLAIPVFFSVVAFLVTLARRRF